MATYQQIIDLAMQQALTGGDSHASPLLDSQLTAEALFPPVMRHVVREFARQGKFNDVEVVHEISLINGVGALPANILREYLEDAYLPDFPYASRCEYLSDYSRHKYTQIEYWTIQSGNIYFSGVIPTVETTRIVDNITIVIDNAEITALPATGGFLADITKRIVLSLAAVDILDTTIISATSDDVCQLNDKPQQNSAVARGTIYTTVGGNLNLCAVSYPVISNNPDDIVPVSDSVADAVVTMIAAVLRGEIPLASITENG